MPDLNSLERNVEVYRKMLNDAIAAGRDTQTISRWLAKAEEALAADSLTELFEAQPIVEISSGEDTPRQAAVRHANHVSANGGGFYEFAYCLNTFLQSHGSGWYTFQESVGDPKVQGWIRHGKKAVEPFLALMVEDGTIEIDNGTPHRIRRRNW